MQNLLGKSSDVLGAKLTIVGTNLAVLGASLVILGGNLAILGANLAVLDVKLGLARHLGCQRGNLGRQLGCLRRQLGYLGRQLESPSYRHCQARPILEGPALKGRAFVLILQDLLGKSNNEPLCSSCRIWGNRATSQALSWPSWAPTLPGQANLGRASPSGQSLRERLGKPWRHSGRWAIMGPTWEQHDPTWANLGPSWGQLPEGSILRER